MQSEIHCHVVEAVLQTALKHNTSVLLNPAPPHSITLDSWKSVTHLVANLVEAAEMAGVQQVNLPQYEKGWQEVSDALHDKGVNYVVITLGEVGVFFSDEAGKGLRLEAKEAVVVDTTSAGDTFLGAYASKIVQMGDDIQMRTAVEFGLEAAAYSVSIKGTYTSIPWGGELASLVVLRRNLHDVHPVMSRGKNNVLYAQTCDVYAYVWRSFKVY